MEVEQLQMIALKNLVPNTGQIEGVKRNPRFIRNAKFERLKDSIIRRPGLLRYKQLMVYPLKAGKAKVKYVIICGNMRYRALKELGYTECLCYVLPEDTPPDTINEYMLVDNVEYGEFDQDILANEFDLELLDICDVDLPNIQDALKAEKGEEADEGEGNNEWDGEAEEEEDEKKNFFLSKLEDCLYPSNNDLEIPTLRLDMMAGNVVVPVIAWGADSRQKAGAGTIHFYVDDYRFEGIWKNPVNVLTSGCKAVVEPNLSLRDTTPLAYGLMNIYKKRWIARYFQDCGIKIYADLNVSIKFMKYNLMGLPDGWNAFWTRGHGERMNELEMKLEQAKQVSGQQEPNLIVYGDGEVVRKWCAKHNLLYQEQFAVIKREAIKKREQFNDRVKQTGGVPFATLPNGDE